MATENPWLFIARAFFLSWIHMAQKWRFWLAKSMTTVPNLPCRDDLHPFGKKLSKSMMSKEGWHIMSFLLGNHHPLEVFVTFGLFWIGWKLCSIVLVNFLGQLHSWWARCRLQPALLRCRSGCESCCHTSEKSCLGGTSTGNHWALFPQTGLGNFILRPPGKGRTCPLGLAIFLVPQRRGIKATTPSAKNVKSSSSKSKADSLWLALPSGQSLYYRSP